MTAAEAPANELVDILMITHNRPRYTELALPRLLESCDETMRVWLWHNGEHGPTLEVVRSYADHPRVHRFHHSVENRKLREPTNWLWGNATGSFLSKVDDDCLVPDGWAQTLRQDLLDASELGVVCCWRFQPEDYLPERAKHKIKELPGGHKLLQNCWVQGSGYVMRADCVRRLGLLGDGQTFIDYCKRIAYAGWTLGWHYPFVLEDHMDDPRSPQTLMRDDDALTGNAPLTARQFGAGTIEERIRQIRAFAIIAQTAPTDPRRYVGWRAALLRLRWLLRGRPDPADLLERKYGIVV